MYEYRVTYTDSNEVDLFETLNELEDWLDKFSDHSNILVDKREEIVIHTDWVRLERS